MSCSTSNWRYWGVLSWSVGSLALWRPMTSQWRKNRFWRKILLLSFVIKFHYITCIGVLMTFHQPDRPIHAQGQGQGQFLVNFMRWRNPKFLNSFDRINFKLGGNVTSAQALSWLVFGGNRPWPLGFLRRSKKWPQGQIFMSHKPYHVVPQIEGVDEYFHDQLEFWRYDVIWRHIKENIKCKNV